jgi:excisionase family DNA binding protein
VPVELLNVPQQPIEVELATHLVHLDEEAARKSLDQAAWPAAAVTAAYQEVERRLGVNDSDGAAVAAAASICIRLLASLPFPDLDPTRAAAVVAAPAEDRVGAEAVAAALRVAGTPADVLCGQLQSPAIARHVSRRRSPAVVVTAGRSRHLPVLADWISAGHSAGVPVVVTGGAFGADDLRALRLGADAWAPDPEAVAGAVGRWNGHQVEPPGHTAANPEAAWLAQQRHALVRSVLECLQPWGGAAAEGNDGDDLVDALFDHLHAAVLVDDGRLLLEFLTADMAAHAGRLLDILASQVPATMERTRAFIEDGRRHLHLVGGGGPRPVPSPVASAEGTASERGQVFSDLLMLAAVSVDAGMALVSVRRGPGAWSTLTYGVERSDLLNDRQVLDFVAEHVRPVEIPDVNNHERLSVTTVAKPPVAARWLFGVPLTGRNGTFLGVMAVLDRSRRNASRRDHRALAAVARQLADQLERWTRPQAAPARAIPGVSRPAALAGRRPASPEGHQLMRSQEVAALFDVTERTVINWAAAGKLPALRTIGGHLRFRHEDVMSLLAGRQRTAG